MKFEFTPDEAITLANLFIKHYKKNNYSIIIEKPVETDAPARTTFIAEKNGVKCIIECQKNVNYHVLKPLALWLAAKRLNAEFYIATDDEAAIPVGALTALKKDGVGLIVYESGSFNFTLEAKNFALILNVDPSIKIGKFKASVNEIVTEFNKGGNGNRKAALRDMCELVEGETEKLIRKCIRKGIIVNIQETALTKMDWSDQINLLARPASFSTPRPIFNDGLKTDFHSFRGARNLIDHKVRGKREEVNRQIQYVERMHQGPRLLGVLLSLNSKIK